MVAGGATGQTLEERSITNAKNYLAINDYERAYSAINFVLRLNAGAGGQPEVRDLAESIFYAYLRDLVESGDIATYESVQLDLGTYPELRSTRIETLIRQTEATIELARQQQLEDSARQRAAEERRLQLEEESRLRMLELEQQQRLNEQLLELQRLEVEELAQRDALLKSDLDRRAETSAEERRQQQEFNQALLALVSAQTGDSSLSTAVIVGIIVVGVVVMFGFIMLILMLIRSNRQQQQYFEYAVRQAEQPREIISIPMFTAPIADRSHLVEHRPDRDLLPDARQDIEQLKGLMQKCREISTQIDERTRRKNTTANVADLVYKVSVYLGYEESDCMLFLAVGLVYDIGFLSMDRDLFDIPHLSEEQFQTLQTHTRRGLERLQFVDDRFRAVFDAGVLKHHENLDGSGYPDGLLADDIPYIARVIHTAESYIAMTSHREFRQMKNKNDAISALMHDSEKYDPEIVEAITNVV
jgi:HD-GYP domain-containing protein (c-di-GMP phosphodiesterase class II)